MKCLLAWGEGLDLKQKKKSQLSAVQNGCVHSSLWNLRLLGTMVSLARSWGWRTVNVTWGPYCSCQDVEPFSLVPKKWSPYMTPTVLLVGHALLHTSKQVIKLFSPFSESWQDLVLGYIYLSGKGEISVVSCKLTSPPASWGVSNSRYADRLLVTAVPLAWVLLTAFVPAWCPFQAGHHHLSPCWSFSPLLVVFWWTSWTVAHFGRTSHPCPLSLKI